MDEEKRRVITHARLLTWDPRPSLRWREEGISRGRPPSFGQFVPVHVLWSIVESETSGWQTQT